MSREIMPKYSDYGLLVSLVALIFFIYATANEIIPLKWGFTFILFFTLYIISIFVSLYPKGESK